MNYVTKVLVLACLLITVALSGVGCAGKPRMGVYEISVAPGGDLSATLSAAPLQVDLVGVSDNDAEKWRAVSVDEYFAGASPLRAETGPSRVTYNFNASESGTKILTVNDQIWAAWKSRGVTQLAILASSRGMQNSAGLDLRKKIIPLTTDRWNNGQRIDIIVGRSGVDCPTAMKPVKQ